MYPVKDPEPREPNWRLVVAGIVLAIVTYVVIAQMVIGAGWGSTIMTLCLTIMGTALLVFFCFDPPRAQAEVRSPLWRRVSIFVVLMLLGLGLDATLLHASIDRDNDSNAREQLINTYVAHWNSQGFALKPENVDIGCQDAGPCKTSGKLGLTNGKCRLVFDIRMINSRIVAVQIVHDEPSGDEREVQMTEDQMQQQFNLFCG